MSNFLECRWGNRGLERARDALRGPQGGAGLGAQPGSLAQGLPVAPHTSRGQQPLISLGFSS